MIAPLEAAALDNIPLFKGLSAHEMARLKSFMHKRTVPAATNLMNIEQPGEVVYIILEGTVKVHIEQPTGGDVILAILGPGEVVGEMGVIDSLGRSASVVTLEPTGVLWLDRASFWDCMEAMPPLTFNLIRILSRRLRLANTQVESLATRDVYGRVAHQILAFGQEYGRTTSAGDVVIPIRLTQTDLADLVGASRVRVNQVLAFYKQHNYISLDSNYRITVHDMTALAARAQ